MTVVKDLMTPTATMEITRSRSFECGIQKRGGECYDAKLICTVCDEYHTYRITDICKRPKNWWKQHLES